MKVEKGQQDAEYRCQARNSLGFDFYIFRLARLGKNIPQKAFTLLSNSLQARSSQGAEESWTLFVFEANLYNTIKFSLKLI